MSRRVVLMLTNQLLVSLTRLPYLHLPLSDSSPLTTMTSYLRSWLYSGTSLVESSTDEIPSLNTISPQASDDEDEGEETEREDDRPPAFPAINSAQRAASPSVPKVLTDSQLMPPPPLPSLAVRRPGVSNAPSDSLAVLTTTKPPPKPSKKSKKVALAPGHSPLDWAALKSSGKDLRVRIFRFVISSAHLGLLIQVHLHLSGC